MTITTEMIMEWGPCDKWPEKRVMEHIGAGKTPLEIADLNHVPSWDRCWILMRPEIIPGYSYYDELTDLSDDARDAADEAMGEVRLTTGWYDAFSVVYDAEWEKRLAAIRELLI